MKSGSQKRHFHEFFSSLVWIFIEQVLTHYEIKFEQFSNKIPSKYIQKLISCAPFHERLF